MAAEDLARLIALDAARAGIPARDEALRVQHVDGVVLHAIDEQAKALLGVAQLFFLSAPHAQVARDLREGEQLSLVVAQRGDDDVRPEARAVLPYPPALVLE